MNTLGMLSSHSELANIFLRALVEYSRDAVLITLNPILHELMDAHQRWRVLIPHDVPFGNHDAVF